MFPLADEMPALVPERARPGRGYLCLRPGPRNSAPPPYARARQNQEDVDGRSDEQLRVRVRDFN